MCHHTTHDLNYTVSFLSCPSCPCAKLCELWDYLRSWPLEHLKDITCPIYGIFCQGQTTRGKCKEFYIGETEPALKIRFLEHKRPSSTSSEASNHIHIESPGHYIDLDEVKILDREEPRWFERGVKEDIYIKVNKPTLNNDGGRYKLPGVYKSILRWSVPKVTTWDSLTLAEDEGSSENSEVWKYFVLRPKFLKKL